MGSEARRELQAAGRICGHPGNQGGPAAGLTYQHQVLPAGEHNITARHPGFGAGTITAGRIVWFSDGEMDSVEVHLLLRRRGIATELWRRARQITPALHHSTSQSTEGAAWAAAIPMDGDQ